MSTRELDEAVYMAARNRLLRNCRICGRPYAEVHRPEDLIKLCTEHRPHYNICYPDACNCGPEGYEEGRKCANPFWGC